MADQLNPVHSKARVENELNRLDAALSRRSAEATAGGGLVRARVDGHFRLTALTIDSRAFDARDAALLADLVMSAIAEAQRRVSESTEPDESGERPATDR